MSTEELYLPVFPGSGPGTAREGHRDSGLLLEAASHIEALERGLMALARLPVHAHAARLGMLHELLRRCDSGIAGELKVTSALRLAGLRQALAGDSDSDEPAR